VLAEDSDDDVPEEPLTVLHVVSSLPVKRSNLLFLTLPAWSVKAKQKCVQ
jgi:hypothetical protein